MGRKRQGRKAAVPAGSGPAPSPTIPGIPPSKILSKPPAPPTKPPTPAGPGSGAKAGYRKPPVEFQWPKGVSGNPHGRPRGTSLTNILLRVLGEIAIDPKSKKELGTYAEALVRSNLLSAIQGDSNLAREIWSRVDGKVPQGFEPVPPGQLSYGERMLVAFAEIEKEEAEERAAAAKKKPPEKRNASRAAPRPAGGDRGPAVGEGEKTSPPVQA